MRYYDFDKFSKDWGATLDKRGEEGAEEVVAERMYTTKDYYYVGWENAKHGILILDFTGTIIDANPYFCNKINYTLDELKGKHVNDFSVKADDLHLSDSINILTLLQSANQQSTNQCNLEQKDHKLIRCRWCASRIPADLNYPFSHSIVHVYFLGDVSYNTMVNEIKRLQDNNAKSDKWFIKLLDSTWTKMCIILIILLTAVGGSLPEIVTKLIEVFNH